MEQQELRAYFFANMYLPSQHAGIQSLHTTAEMFVKYAQPNTIFFSEEDGKTRDILFDWAENHKTTIVLNGGMSGDLQELLTLFESKDNQYPWSFFKETEYTLNGALTNVGIILPEKIYTYDKVVCEYEAIEKRGYNPVFNLPALTEYEMEIVEALRGKRLMS